MTEDQILAGVRHVLADRLRVERPIHRDLHVLRDLHLDSIQQFALVVELENHFQVCFEPGDEEGIATVGDVTRLVARRLAAEREAGAGAWREAPDAD